MIMNTEDFISMDIGTTHIATAVYAWLMDLLGTLWQEVIKFEINDERDLLVTLKVTPFVEAQYSDAKGKELYVLNLGEDRPPYWVENGEIHAWS